MSRGDIIDLRPSEEVVADSRGTIELMTWRGEAAILLDGSYVLRRSFILRQLERYKRRGSRCHRSACKK